MQPACRSRIPIVPPLLGYGPLVDAARSMDDGDGRALDLPPMFTGSEPPPAGPKTRPVEPMNVRQHLLIITAVAGPIVAGCHDGGGVERRHLFPLVASSGKS